MRCDSKLIICLLLTTMMLAFSCNNNSGTISNQITFKNKLSEYELFGSNMSELIPANGVMPIEIASPLFTDYAEKQRLIKLPVGTKMTIKGDSLPVFPDGTIIAKTFYYSSTEKGKRIIETRLLILAEGGWNAATYQWNTAQNDADLLADGALVPVSFQDLQGRHRRIEYKIPSQKDCSSCHRSGNELVPLGSKMRNLNINISVNGTQQNQFEYLIKKGILDQANISKVTSLPDYKDSTLALETRARAYLEMNCAHCHQEQGTASGTSLNLNYTTSFEKTRIQFNKENILIRMSEMGEYHMPKSGVTVLDDEGVKLIRDYIKIL